MRLLTIRTARAAAIDHLTHQLASERQRSQWLKDYAEKVTRERNEAQSRALDAERKVGARDQLIREQENLIAELKAAVGLAYTADTEVRYECASCEFMAGGPAAIVASPLHEHVMRTGHRNGRTIRTDEVPA